MSSYNNTHLSFASYLAAFCLFSNIPAFYVWHTKIPLILSLCFFIIVLYENYKRNWKINLSFSIILFAISFVIIGFKAQFNFFGWLELFCIFSVFLAEPHFLKATFNAFGKVFSITMFLSLVVYVFVVLLKVNLPHVPILSLNVLKPYNYYLYPFLIVTDQDLSSNSLRFMGLFDEPGVVGTISAILLVANRFDLKRKENIVLLLSGIASFSLFFYVVCAIYVLLIIPRQTKLLYIVGLFLLFVGFHDNVALNELVFSRFQLEEGRFLGDTRATIEFDEFYKNFRHTSQYWTGLGSGMGTILNQGGSSYKQVVVNYGMICFMIYNLGYLVVVFNKLKKFKTIFVFALVFIGTMYQRPFVTNISITFLIVSSLFIIKDNYNNSLTAIKTI